MKLNFFSIFIFASLAAVTMTGFTKKHPQIVCFGDSITHGAQVEGHSWVYFLSEDHTNIDFVNEGRNGRKTADREELLPVLKQFPGAEYFLIFLGVNDLKDGNDSMVNSCVENMSWMIAEIRKVNSKSKIVILAPSDINLQSINAINKSKKYNANTKKSLYVLEKRYKKLAASLHTGFISLLHTVPKPDYADGLHPNIAGQKQIAEAIWKQLKKSIKD